jgi:Spy/CpxP family protein refolding chaperone
VGVKAWFGFGGRGRQSGGTLTRSPALKRNDTRRYRGETTARPLATTMASVFNPFLKDPAMKPWIKRTLYAAFGLVLVGGALSACSDRHHGERHGRISAEDVAEWRGKVVERASRELALDEAQKQRLGVLFDKMNEQRVALMGSSPDPRAAMQPLIAGATFDRERATALLAEKTDAVRLKSPEVITAAADFYDSLKPEQQARVREVLNKRHGWRS